MRDPKLRIEISADGSQAEAEFRRVEATLRASLGKMHADFTKRLGQPLTPAVNVAAMEADITRSVDRMRAKLATLNQIQIKPQFAGVPGANAFATAPLAFGGSPVRNAKTGTASGVPAAPSLPSLTPATNEAMRLNREYRAGIIGVSDYRQKLTALSQTATAGSRDQINALILLKREREKDTAEIERQERAARRAGPILSAVLTSRFKLGSAQPLVGRTAAALGLDTGNRGQMMAAAAGGAIATVGTYSLKKAIDWESAFAEVQKFTTGTKGELDKLKKDIAALSVDPLVGTDFEQLARIAAFGAQLGVARESLVEFTRNIAYLGKAGDISGEEAATGISKIAAAMNLSSDSYPRLASVLVSMGELGSSTMREILDITRRFASEAKNLKLSPDQVFAYANAVASLGQEAEAGGTALTSLFAKVDRAVTSGTPQLALYARLAGVTGEKFSQMFRADPSGAMQKVLKGLSDLSAQAGKVGQVMDALEIKEVRQRQALQNLSAGHELLGRALDAAKVGYEGKNKAEEKARIQAETTREKLNQYRREVDLLAATMGDSLIPTLRSVLSAGRPVLGMIKDLSDRFNALSDSAKNQVVISIIAGAGLIALGKTIAEIYMGLKQIQAMNAIVAGSGAAAGAGGLGAMFAGGVAKLGGGAAIASAALPAAAAVGGGLVAKHFSDEADAAADEAARVSGANEQLRRRQGFLDQFKKLARDAKQGTEAIGVLTGKTKPSGFGSAHLARDQARGTIGRIVAENRLSSMVAELRKAGASENAILAKVVKEINDRRDYVMKRAVDLRPGANRLIAGKPIAAARSNTGGPIVDDLLTKSKRAGKETDDRTAAIAARGRVESARDALQAGLSAFRDTSGDTYLSQTKAQKDAALKSLQRLANFAEKAVRDEEEAQYRDRLQSRRQSLIRQAITDGLTQKAAEQFASATMRGGDNETKNIVAEHAVAMKRIAAEQSERYRAIADAEDAVQKAAAVRRKDREKETVDDARTAGKIATSAAREIERALEDRLSDLSGSGQRGERARTLGQLLGETDPNARKPLLSGLNAPGANPLAMSQTIQSLFGARGNSALAGLREGIEEARARDLADGKNPDLGQQSREGTRLRAEAFSEFWANLKAIDRERAQNLLRMTSDQMEDDYRLHEAQADNIQNIEDRYAAMFGKMGDSLGGLAEEYLKLLAARGESGDAIAQERARLTREAREMSAQISGERGERFLSAAAQGDRTGLASARAAFDARLDATAPKDRAQAIFDELDQIARTLEIARLRVAKVTVDQGGTTRLDNSDANGPAVTAADMTPRVVELGRKLSQGATPEQLAAWQGRLVDYLRTQIEPDLSRIDTLGARDRQNAYRAMIAQLQAIEGLPPGVASAVAQSVSERAGRPLQPRELRNEETREFYQFRANGDLLMNLDDNLNRVGEGFVENLLNGDTNAFANFGKNIQRSLAATFSQVIWRELLEAPLSQALRRAIGGGRAQVATLPTFPGAPTLPDIPAIFGPQLSPGQSVPESAKSLVRVPSWAGEFSKIDVGRAMGASNRAANGNGNTGESFIPQLLPTMPLDLLGLDFSRVPNASGSDPALSENATATKTNTTATKNSAKATLTLASQVYGLATLLSQRGGSGQGGKPDALDTVAGIASLFPAAAPFAAGFKMVRGLFGFDSGGRPQVNRPAVVGERGPEIFVPDTPGRILSTDQIFAAMTAQGQSRLAKMADGIGGGGMNDAVRKVAVSLVPQAGQGTGLSEASAKFVKDAAASRGSAPGSGGGVNIENLVLDADFFGGIHSGGDHNSNARQMAEALRIAISNPS